MVIGDICKIDGCENVLKKIEGRICQMHRTRFFRHKDYNFVSPNWTNLKKGQPCLTKFGYLRININGKRVLQHRYIMEKSLRRKLTKNERIHHKNSIKTDNRIENLELYKSNSEHMKISHQTNWKKRKNTIEIIGKVLERLGKPKRSFDICFCGKTIRTRNLCSKHYQWAYKHNLY